MQKSELQITRNLRQSIGERLRLVQLAHTNRQPENIVAKMPGATKIHTIVFVVMSLT